MLSLERLTLRISHDEEVRPLLSDVSARFQRGQFVAVIGPSGCGKSTLLKMIAGIASGDEEGIIRWDGRNLGEEDFKPSEFGYVPQFSIAHKELTVVECVDYSCRLRVSGLDGRQRADRVSGLLKEVGLEEFHDRMVKVLSGGQKRRLALAMELVSSPPILLCDEVTSGLDPQSEEEIVGLLRRVAHEGKRLVISVTHSLKDIATYDKVVVLYKGVLAYEGVPGHLAHYFSADVPEKIYSRLEERDAEGWQSSWEKHAGAFASDDTAEGIGENRPVVGLLCPECGHPAESGIRFCGDCGARIGSGVPEADSGSGERYPGFLSQLATLLGRRVKIFFRSPGQLWLQAGLILGFPCMVAIFGWNGLPQVKNLGMGLDLNVIQQLTEARDFLIQASKVGSLVSGIIMFEVILLTLMGANNSGREIAAERGIFEKEKLSGLDSGAYLLSKLLYLGILSAVQSCWMGMFVHFTCSFPGDLLPQLMFLFLVNFAMTSICLAVSSFMATAEQASLVSIYLVGFQLPLSGAVLALPSWLGPVVRPFISAYWSWSGMLETLKGERYYDIVRMVIQTGLSAADLCLTVLLLHVFAGIVLSYQGCRQTRME